MSIDWTNVALGSTIWLMVALAAGMVASTVRSIASAAGREHSTPLDWLHWWGILTAAVFVVGQLCYWSLRIGWALHTGSLFTNSAG